MALVTPSSMATIASGRDGVRPAPTDGAANADTAILDEVHAAVVTVGCSGQIVRYNRAAERLWGYPPEEVIGEPLEMLLPEVIRGRHGRWLDSFADTGRTSRAMGTGGVMKGNDRSGKPFWAIASISRSTGPDGPLLTAVLTDITEQHLGAEQASLLRGALENADTMACLADSRGAVGHASQSLLSFWGVTGWQPSKECHVERFLGGTATADSMLAQVATTGTWAADLQVTVGRELKDLRAVARAVHPDADTSSVVVSFLDRTHVQRIERELQHSIAILAKAQELTHLGSWALTLETGELAWSEEVFRIFGLDHDAIEPSYARFLERVHPEDRGTVETAVTAAVEDNVGYDLLHRVVRPDGGIRQVREIAEVERDRDGTPLRMVGTVQDITEEAKQLAALEASERFSRSVLDSMTSHAAILDRRGMVVATNRAWQRFAQRNGATTSMGIGMDYRDVARRGLRDQTRDAATIAEAVGGVLSGKLSSFRADYEFHLGSGRPLWYELRIEPLDTPEGGAVVLHDDITARKLAETELAHRALHDPLTALPNRELLLRRAAVALRDLRQSPGHVGLIFLDLDRFKIVNDSLGHATGDEVLSMVADRLRGCVRDVDTLCRFGGDEFVVLAPNLDDPDHARRLAERIIAAFEDPITIGTQEFDLRSSIGVATSNDAGTAAATLLRDADSAMYRAKELGRARCVVHDARLRDEALHRLNLIQELRGAADRHELSLHYQGQHDLSTGEVVGFEALLRWHHPVHGDVGPAVFIPIAEESATIIDLGAWVLTEACLQATVWLRSGHLRSTGHIAVNVSTRQLNHPGFIDLVASSLRAAGLPPANLCLEITESVLMSDIEAASQVLQELKELGVRIAIDDFGTGHASLGYLTSLPLDELKIDRVFVAALGTDVRADAVASSILALAKALDLEVVAEGIETQAQLEWLRRMSCVRGQGYLLSRPALPDVPGASVRLWSGAERRPHGRVRTEPQYAVEMVSR